MSEADCCKKVDELEAVEVAAHNLVAVARTQRQALKDFAQLLEERSKALDLREADLNRRLGEVAVSEDKVRNIRNYADEQKQKAMVAKDIADRAYEERQKAKVEADMARKEREIAKDMVKTLLADNDKLLAEKAALTKRVKELESQPTPWAAPAPTL